MYKASTRQQLPLTVNFMGTLQPINNELPSDGSGLVVGVS